MVQKLNAQTGENKAPKISRLLRNSLLAGALAISGCAASVAAPPQPPAAACPVKPKPLEIQCNGKMNYVGQWEGMVIGVTDRASYRFTITEISGDSVSADVRVPVLASDGPALGSLAFRFNDIKFTRQSITHVAEYLCAEVEEGREREPPRIANPQAGNVFASGPARLVQASGFQSTDMGQMLKELLGSGAVSQAIAHVALLGIGRIGHGTESAKFSVGRTSDNEYLVRITEGYFTGREFRLDRKLDFSVDYNSEEEHGFMRLPMRIEKLAADKESYEIKLGMDCSRDIEVSSPSVTYSGPNPSCKEKLGKK